MLERRKKRDYSEEFKNQMVQLYNAGKSDCHCNYAHFFSIHRKELFQP